MIKRPLRSRGDRRAERGERVLAPHARQQEHRRVRVGLGPRALERLGARLCRLAAAAARVVGSHVVARLVDGVGPAAGEARIFRACECAASAIEISDAKVPDPAQFTR